MDTNKKRALELLKKMTLREKVGQLAHGFYGFNAYKRDENGEIVLTEEFKEYIQKFGGAGLLYGFFRSDPWSKKDYRTGGIVLSEREKAYNILQKYVVENTRLGIPVMLEDEAPHGRQILDSVLYPVSLNVGCSFNTKLHSKQTEMIGKETLLGGVQVAYQSVMDIAIDPRWGRTEECFSEDPYLTSQFSKAAVEGMNESGCMVCCKHFAAQGGMLGGLNSGAVNIGERELREIHLPPAKAAVEAGCDFIMSTYNEIDGVPCNGNSYLNNDILRDEFGFDGVVQADGCSIDFMAGHFRGDLAKSAAVAIESGVDCGLWDVALTKLEEAVEKGYITEDKIDVAVCRILEKKFKSGLMDNYYFEEDNQSEKFINSGVPQKVAYDMATESLVLLKNDDNILPLSKNKKVLLIGENFDNIYYLLGDYTSERKNPNTVRNQFVSNGAEYIEGWNFEKGITVSDHELEKAVNNADVIIFGFGGSSVRDFNSTYNGAGAINSSQIFMDCGEGRDLADLKLVPSQTELIKKVASFGKPVISLGIAGRPYIIDEICDNSKAVIWCGYPGDEGAKAIFDTVYGDANNFGRMSVTFPRSVAQLPVYYYRKCSKDYVDIKNRPLFCFGYGLSYSEFEYSDINVSGCTLEELKNGKKIKIDFSVKNISSVAGKAVPQLYIKREGGTVTHRHKELRGFDKISLEAGESKRVSFELGFEELKEWSIFKKYELFNMKLIMMIGESLENILLADEIEL